MQTSRFQLGLIAALAMGLGLALSSSPAIGYPAGAAVSFGANPLWPLESSGRGIVLALFSLTSLAQTLPEAPACQSYCS